MEKNLVEKMELIKQINTDDSSFILRVCESYINNQKKLNEKRKNTSIILKEKSQSIEGNVIDLDTIYVKPYLYTKMRIKLEDIINKVINVKETDILNNPIEFCNNTIFNQVSKEFKKEENHIYLLPIK